MRTFSSISSLAFLLALGHCLPQGFEAERPAGDELAQSANPFTGIGGSGDFGDNGGGLQPTDIDFTGGFQPGQLATLAVFNEEEGVLEGTLLEGPDGSVTALDAAGRPLDFNAEGELVAPASGELQSFSSKSGELFAVSASALKGGTLADIWRFIKEYGTAAWVSRPNTCIACYSRSSSECSES